MTAPSQPSADVKQGIDLLLNQLLPTVIGKLKALEQRTADLEKELEALKSAPKPAPRKRVKKEKTEAPAERVEFKITPEQEQAIREMYQQTAGVPIQTLEILTDADGNNLTVNTDAVTTETVDRIKNLIAENPAATPQDIAVNLKLPTVVVCFVIVMFGL